MACKVTERVTILLLGASYGDKGCSYYHSGKVLVFVWHFSLPSLVRLIATISYENTLGLY